MNALLSTSLCAAALAAQDPAPQTAPDAPAARTQAASRLDKALDTMHDLPSCAFAASWGPKDKAQGQAGAVAVLFAGPGGTSGAEIPGEATGIWDQDALWLQSGDDQLLFRGRRMLARDQAGASDWVVRRDRYSNGARLEYVPDPQLLLELLAGMDLDVTHRAPGAIEQFPVEVVSVELTPEQIAELAWSGAIPMATGSMGPMIAARLLAARGAGGPGRPAAELPTATVDLAIAFDPGTGFVHRVQVRSYDDQQAPGVARVFVAGGAAGGAIRVAAGQEDEDDEDDDEPEVDEDAPLTYTDGLPNRSRKDKAVTEYTVTFTQHGAARLPK